MLHLHASISFLHPFSLCCTALHNTWYLMSVLRGLDPLVPLHSRVIQAIVPANAPKDFLTKCIEIIVSIYSFQTDSNWTRFLMSSQSQPNTCTIYQLQVSIKFHVTTRIEMALAILLVWGHTKIGIFLATHLALIGVQVNKWPMVPQTSWTRPWMDPSMPLFWFFYLLAMWNLQDNHCIYIVRQSTSSLPSIQLHHPVLLHRSTLHVRPFHNLPNPTGHPAEICDGKIRPSLVRRRREIHFYHPPGMARHFGDGCIFNGPCVQKIPKMTNLVVICQWWYLCFILCFITLYIWEKGAHHVILKKRYQNIQPFVVACSSTCIVLHPRC